MSLCCSWKFNINFELFRGILKLIKKKPTIIFILGYFLILIYFMMINLIDFIIVIFAKNWLN